jgi:hypothetical protein
MERACDFSPFTAESCDLVVSADAGSCTIGFRAGAEGLLAAAAEHLADAGVWREARFLWFDALNQGPSSMALTLSFWDAENATVAPDLVSTIGLLPDLPTRVSFPLAALDSQRMYLPRIPGALKRVIHGNKVRALARLAIGRKACSEAQSLRISGLRLSIEEPPHPVPDAVLVDELGQWKKGDWPGKTRNAASMAEDMRRMLASSRSAAFFPTWNPDGSWKDRRYDASGFFRTHHDGRRWWLVDPEGYAFHSIGVDCVRPGEGCNVTGIRALCGPLPPKEDAIDGLWADGGRFGLPGVELYNFTVANLERVFAKQWRDAWAGITRANLLRWGFNTVGNWSDPGFARSARLPWVLPMDGFPGTKVTIFRDFPDVFSPEYEKNAAAFAHQMQPLREDRFLVGYFLRNEPEWAFIRGLVIAEELLETGFPTQSREALIRFLSERYRGEVALLNVAWNTRFPSFDGLRAPLLKASRLSPSAAEDLHAFSRIMIDRYVRVPSQAVRRVDPHHLNLGMRWGILSSDDIMAGCDSFDVFSINCYDEDPGDALETAGSLSNLPVMIGEFHFGSLDRGLSATGIRGAADQTERGRAYRHYVEKAAASPYCVGTHYFQYNEQPALGRFDGENYDIGLVDVCQTPLRELVEQARECHAGLYRIAAGEEAPTQVKGRLIHPIFY